MTQICPLCLRELDPRDSDRHHLTPRQKGGARGATVDIHRFCHTKIHSVLTNGQLARGFNTIEKLREHPEIQRFIEWVADKPSGFIMKNARTSDRRGRR